MNKVQLRSVLIKSVLGCLIVAAVVAIIAILIGNFDDLTWRALWTVGSAIVHIVVLLALLSNLSNDDSRTNRSSDIVINASLVITALSFFTSVLSIWEALMGPIIGKLYATYTISLIAILHAKALDDIRVRFGELSKLILANFACIALVVVLLLGAVYFDPLYNLLGGFYGRLLAVSVIIDVTLGIIVAVMQRLHMSNHPEIAQHEKSSQTQSTRSLVSTIILTIIVVAILMRLMFLPMM